MFEIFRPFFLSENKGLAKNRYCHEIGRKKIRRMVYSDPEKLIGRPMFDTFSFFWRLSHSSFRSAGTVPNVVDTQCLWISGVPDKVVPDIVNNTILLIKKFNNWALKDPKGLKIAKIWFFKKLINQLQVRIQAEPPHGKYSGGNSAFFLASKLFLKNMIFPDPLNLLLGTSDDSKWHPKGPQTFLGKSVFWPSSTFLVAIFWPSSWPSMCMGCV